MIRGDEDEEEDTGSTRGGCDALEKDAKDSA